jgi:hypothetical protein
VKNRKRGGFSIQGALFNLKDPIVIVAAVARQQQR